jgi:hypothetical protein
MSVAHGSALVPESGSPVAASAAHRRTALPSLRG